ncbi:flagellar hook-associated protein FlgK [Opitutus terrae]|uniref:Flagellar hook-associated protein 1 n=1 Tax=Opitutus terrae (strain DSM 11246 / JCM 15787 / PB90-1) TaxID=452637 RepID=B1ZR14_OPITP|nr:flagellar hook-associated protein FlgK [Opitutus terrae]ACB73681.1 flagellar hook-associated protein FlgK [Opitutus terrae PB90-1]
MSGLFASLNSTVGALSAHSRSIETAGKNLANVNNASYARQRVVYGDRGTIVTPDGAYSLGLEALGVQQLRDMLIDNQVTRETSLTSYFAAQQKAYQRAQAALGQDISSVGSSVSASASTSDAGIGAGLDDLFNAFQGFASNPTDTGIRQSLLQTASILTDRVQLADKRLAQVQADLHSQIQTDVGEANKLLATISDLNNQIARFEVERPGSAVDLRDQRQAALEKLATKLTIDVQEISTGQVIVSSPDANGAPVVLVDSDSITGPVSFDPATDTISAGTPTTVLGLTSGAIQGSLSAHNEGVQPLRDQLTLIAQQLTASVNEIYNPGGVAADDFFATLDGNGDPITAGTFQLASGLTAFSLHANDGTAGAPAGDNSVALAIAQLATRRFSTTGAPPDLIDGTLSSFYSSAVSGLGQATAGATTRLNSQESIEQLVRSQRDAVSGVSLDEELSDLLKYQRAFQASSRVFQTIDKLLGVVVEQLGV